MPCTFTTRFLSRRPAVSIVTMTSASNSSVPSLCSSNSSKALFNKGASCLIRSVLETLRSNCNFLMGTMVRAAARSISITCSISYVFEPAWASIACEGVEYSIFHACMSDHNFNAIYILYSYANFLLAPTCEQLKGHLC